jgi:hypothetical protein
MNRSGMMRVDVKVLSFVLLAFIFAFVPAACGKKVAGPTDTDVAKAVTAMVESEGGTLESSVTILERGAQSGSDWPVKVEFTYKAKDGSSQKKSQTFQLTSSINDMGVPVWMAK